MKIPARLLAMHLTLLTGLAVASPALAGGLFSRPVEVPAVGLLVSGLIRPEGATLEPAFFSAGEASQIPAGPYRLRFLDRHGRLLKEVPFQAKEDPSLAGYRSFAFVVPLGRRVRTAMATLELHADAHVASIRSSLAADRAQVAPIQAQRQEPGEVLLTWDPASYPAIRVQDAAGHGIGQGGRGSLVLYTDSPTLKVTLSDGLRSVEEIVEVRN